jgi:uncharacterized membrane protein YbhN (UPF0104 family)
VEDVRPVVDAFDAFVSHLAAVAWIPVGIAVGLHLVRLACRARAWQHIVAAACPRDRFGYGTALGAYVAGVGVNAIAPARAGDVLKVYLAKRQLPDASYATLASTLVVETLFDFVVGIGLFTWAISAGVLPGVPDISRLSALDWRLVVEHPRLAAIAAGVLAGLGVLAFAWCSKRARAFWAHVRDGFVILSDRRAFFTQVVSWQALSWVARYFAVAEFLRAFHVDSSPQIVLSVLVVGSLSTLLPFTPGGVGTQQAVLVFVLGGTTSAAAVLSFSIGMHAISVALNVVVGFTAIGAMLRTLRWRDQVRDAARVTPEPAALPSQTAAQG